MSFSCKRASNLFSSHFLTNLLFSRFSVTRSLAVYRTIFLMSRFAPLWGRRDLFFFPFFQKTREMHDECLCLASGCKMESSVSNLKDRTWNQVHIFLWNPSVRLFSLPPKRMWVLYGRFFNTKLITTGQEREFLRLYFRKLNYQKPAYFENEERRRRKNFPEWPKSYWRISKQASQDRWIRPFIVPEFRSNKRRRILRKKEGGISRF